MRFTEAQMEAVQAENPELLVSAAAGSGKTAVLVERIVRMIAQHGMGVDRMLIVTFTRAAAAEMRERLEARLEEEAQNNPALQKQAELVSTAQISTLHSFCQRVVRENFQHCEIDPQFTLADERTSELLYQESLEDTLDYIYHAAQTDQNLSALIGKFNERDIAAMLQMLYRFLMSRPNPMSWIKEQAHTEWLAETLNDQPMAKTFCEEAALVLQGMGILWAQARELSQNPSFPDAYRKTMQSDGQTIQELNAACARGFNELVQTLGGLKFAVLARFKPETDDEELQAQAYKSLRGRYKALTDDLRKLLPSDCAAGVSDMQAMQPTVGGLCKAVERLHEDFSTRKRDQSVLDFQDLEHMALSVLSDQVLGRRQSNQFDAVFVDEYQDISALQEALLNALKGNEYETKKPFFFYVGDVKQSIYRFRQAEPGLFLGKLNSFSASKEACQRKIILNRNFRSRSGVLDAVNRVFEHVMDKRVTEIDYDQDVRLYPGSESRGDPVVEAHVLNSFGKKPADMLLAEAELIARDILQTVGKPIYDAEGNECGLLKYRDIAILTQVGKNVIDKVELVLRQAGIPVYSESAVDGFQSSEASQILQHLLLMDNLMNDVALISELRSPLFEMSEQELAQVRLLLPQREASFLTALQFTATQSQNKDLARRCGNALLTLEQERFRYQSMPLEEYLWGFLLRSGLYAHHGAQPGGKLRQANLRALCYQAGEYVKMHGDGLTGFLESAQLGKGSGGLSPTVINPWEDVVRLMTIHKSKGLEFPTVYLMGLGGALRRKTTTRTFSVHNEMGLGIGYVNELARTKRTTLLQSAIELKERSAERAERARVLYVAMTRPKNRLVMLGSLSEKYISIESLRADVEKACGSAESALKVREANSMLEWVLQCVDSRDILQDEKDGGFSIEPTWESGDDTELTTEPTSYPHKTGGWRIVFHSEPVIATGSQRGRKVKREIPLIPLAFAVKPLSDQEERNFSIPDVMKDPIAPAMDFAHRPLKIGVTALCRAMGEPGGGGRRELDEEAAQEETPRDKRNPLWLSRPKRLSALPDSPSFLSAAHESDALEQGVQTHKLLGLFNLSAARQAAARPSELEQALRGELRRLTESGVLSEAEAKQANWRMAARFLESELGARALRAETLHREWSFNLRIEEPVNIILQGVIDLCFLEAGGWVMVDFKTDRVRTAEELWERYEKQMAFYCDALKRATPYPVAECALFSLRTGEASIRSAGSVKI